MNSFGPQSYSTCLKRLIPSNFKMNKEAILLMCSIIYEINLNLLKACLSRKNGAKEVTAKYIESSIRLLLPKELRACALAAGYSEIVRFQSGLIIYRDPKIPKPSNLDPNMLRKGLQQLAETSHRNLTLSKNCSTIGCVIYKLAVQITERSISTKVGNNEILLEDMRNTVYNILGDELFNHAEGHATSNLNWYLSDTLDFTLKPLQCDYKEEKMEEESELLQRYVQKLAKSQYSISFTKNGAKTVDKLLTEIVNRILEDTGNFVVNKVLQNLAVSEYVMYEVVQKLFPPVMFKLACSYAQGRVLNYSCGILKYEYKRPVEEIEVVPVQQEVEFTEENILPNYRNAVKRLMYEYHCTPDKGFLPLMNNILNDISVVFADICSQSAQRKGSILSENDVFAAVHALLPEGLRNHAFARIVHVGRECPPQNKQLIDMWLFTPNQAAYQQALSSTVQPSQLTDKIAVATPLEESSLDTILKDSKEGFARQSLPLKSVSSFLKNEQPITNRQDDSMSPISDYFLEKPQITEAKCQEQSHSSIRRQFEGNKPNETSIEHILRQDSETVHREDIPNRLSGLVSEMHSEYPKNEVSKRDISADNSKERQSIIHEVKLSNFPSLPVRTSKDKTPFPDYLPEKPEITEIKSQERSYTSLKRSFEGEKPVGTSMEKLGMRDRASVDSDKSRRLRGVVSDIDAEYPKSQVSQRDISADNSKERQSIINEVKLSNVPSLPVRASKDIAPFPDYIPEKPEIMEVKSQNCSYTSVKRSFEELKPVGISMEKISTRDRETVDIAESRKLSGVVSGTDAEYPKRHVSHRDISADSSNQRQSIINEVKLSNVPNLHVTESKDKTPFPDYLPEKPEITEVKRQEGSYTSVKRSFEGEKPVVTSLEKLSTQDRESVESDKSRRLNGVVSEIDAEYPKRHVSQSDISADNREQRSSIFNDVKLSNDTSLPIRTSEDLGQNFQTENYYSLDPPLPRRESVLKLGEEEISKTSDKGVNNSLPEESEMEKNNEEQELQTSNIYGEKALLEENGEISFLRHASESSNTFGKQNQNNQHLPENIPDKERETIFDDKKIEMQSRKESMHPESINNTQNQLLQEAFTSRDETRSTPIKNGMGVLTSASGSKTVLSNNNGSRPRPNEDRLINLPTENKSGSSDQVQHTKSSTNGEQKSTSVNEGNRLSSIFDLLQQFSNTILYPFQGMMDTSQESLTPDKQLSDDVSNRSSREKLINSSSKVLNGEYTEDVDEVISNNDMNSMETLTGRETQLKFTKHRSSLSDYVSERLKKIEDDQFYDFDDIIPTTEENVQDKLRNLYLSEEAGSQKQIPRNIPEQEMKNTIFNSFQGEEISADDNKETEEKEHEIFFLDIQRTIFWNDVRPYDILM